VITRLSPIDVEFAVPQDHAAWLQHNAGAFMEVRALDRTRTTLLDTGVFSSLDNQIDTQTGTVRAKARFNNARQQLFPSQFVNVQLQLRTIQNAVVVPVAAVRQSSSGEYVFVLQQDRTVKQRTVVRGQALGDRVQIVSGLAVGERVITEGADRLRDGSRVNLAGEGPAAGGRRRGASAPAGAASGPSELAPGARPASEPFTGASAAQAPGGRGSGPQREATSPFARSPAPAPAASEAAAAATGADSGEARGGGRFQNLSPEERAARLAEWQKLTPEQREERRRQRRAAREAGAGQQPAQ
jgi:multidrug efflux system membrane fusion protein